MLPATLLMGSTGVSGHKREPRHPFSLAQLSLSLLLFEFKKQLRSKTWPGSEDNIDLTCVCSLAVIDSCGNDQANIKQISVKHSIPT